MKKIITFFLAVLLIAAMAVPVLAAGDEIPGRELVSNLPTPYETNYYTILTDGTAYYMAVSGEPYFYDNGFGKGYDIERYDYEYTENGWEFLKVSAPDVVTTPINTIVYLSYDLADRDGHIYISKSSVFDPVEDSPQTPVYCLCNYPIADEDDNGFCDICGEQVFVTGTVDVIYGLTFPSLSTVWIDKDKYTVASIYQEKSTGAYRLVLGQAFDIDYCHASENGAAYYKIGSAYAIYDLVDRKWEKAVETSGSLAPLQSKATLIWASKTIYTDSTRVHDFFYVPPSVAGSVTDSMLLAVLTEIIAILPVGLACLVGYLTLRKGLLVLEKVLFQA